MRFGVFTIAIPDTVTTSTRVRAVTPAGDWLRKALESGGPSAIALAVDPCVSTRRLRAEEPSSLE
jgi:hypothetical protein